MPAEMNLNAWRVLAESGVVRMSPMPQKSSTHRDWWAGVVGVSLHGYGTTPRGAVGAWADLHVQNWREIAKPGQLFAHEQVALETAHITGLLEWWANYCAEAAGHLKGVRSTEQFAFHRGLLHVLELVAKGERAPPTDPMEEARRACSTYQPQSHARGK